MSAPLPAPHPLHELYRHHHGWLYGLLRRKLGSEGDAADLAQDVFVRLLVKPRQFDGESGARAYLSTMARGMCIDLWRRRDLEAAWLAALAAKPEITEPSPEQRALIFEALRQVDAVLRQLPSKTADAFVMAMVYGMSDADIATRLGVSDRMVRKHTARAMLQCMVLRMQDDPAPLSA